MASEIDIANLALSYLGDTATVASLSPPEGSPQAEHAARFYPLARDALLEMHTWGFATKRAPMSELSVTPPSGWQHVYAVPADAVNLLAVLDPNAPDDYSAPVTLPGTVPGLGAVGVGGYQPQAFEAEILADGTQVIYTNQMQAVLRYTAMVTDTAQFSALFTAALSWFLASMLAGPIVKGDAGAKQAVICMQQVQLFLTKAADSDANQRKVVPAQTVPWIGNR